MRPPVPPVEAGPRAGSPGRPLPVALRLSGRRVVLVGGGQAAQRRLPSLIASGADVVVVAPDVTPAVEGLATAGEIDWQRRAFVAGDVDEAWYVVSATSDEALDAVVASTCEARRVLCDVVDHVELSSASAPAVGHHDGLTVAVLEDGEPRRSAALRDALMTAVLDGRVDAVEPRSSTPGVTLVGGGPGDPELISVAGRRALMQADVVVADRLAPRELLGDLRPDVELVDVAKLPRGRSAHQDEINRVIVARASAGHHVVRFKGGDSFVFGRGYEEVLACRAAGVPVRVIPGLSSPLAVPALAGIPVTHRGVAHELTVISGHLPPGHPESLTDWASVSGLRGTLVLMMAVENAPRIAAALLDGGRPGRTPVGVVCDGSMPTERTVLSTLEDLADDLVRHDVRPPAVIVVGDVVAVAHPERYPDRLRPVPDAERPG